MAERSGGRCNRDGGVKSQNSDGSRCLAWPEEEDDSLWPLSLTHAAHLFNHTPSQFNGIAPVEVFTSTLSDHEMLRNTHTWGSPVYVLEPRLTSAGGKIPKWQPRSRRGQYVGASPLHAENVALVRNLKTGYLSPQFHVVFDDWFETVHSGPELPPEKWEDMCTFQRWEVVFDEGPAPQLKEEWLSPEEVEERRFRRGQGTQPEPPGDGFIKIFRLEKTGKTWPLNH